MNGINMSTVTNYMLGSTQVNYIYCGSTLVWPLTTGTDYFYILADFELTPQPGTSIPESYTKYVEFDLIEGQTLYYSFNQRSWMPVTNAIRTNEKSIRYPNNVSGPYEHDFNTITYRIALDNRSIVYLKGNLTSYLGTFNSYKLNTTMFQIYDVYASDDPDTTHYHQDTYEIGGNLLSLMYNTDNVYSFTNAQNEAYNFYGAFSSGNQYIGDISNLIFPNNTVPYCYGYMFGFPASFTTAPELPATTLSEGAYYHMFDECMNLNNVTCLATDISATNCTTDWLNNVAATGTFTRDQNNTSWTIGTSGIPSGWTVVPPLAHDYSQDYLTFEALENGTFTWTASTSSNSIYYSTNNGSTWSRLASNSSTPVITANNKVMFKASGLSAGYNGIGTFSSTGAFNAMGNIMSLVYGDNFINQTTISNNSQFVNLFKNSRIVDASNLILPATTLTVQCYQNMFQGCTSLTAAPEKLPATTLSDYCYYYMFYGCTNLTATPELPATRLTKYCYNSMFRECTSLNSITCLATNISASNCTSYWVSGVASSGTFTKSAYMNNWRTGSDGIPSGWTVQDAS